MDITSQCWIFSFLNCSKRHNLNSIACSLEALKAEKGDLKEISLYYKTMGDPNSRRNQTRNRLRAQLRKKRESLADQFDFKIYIAFVFKEKVLDALT